MPLLFHVKQGVRSTLLDTANSSITVFRYMYLEGQVQNFGGPGRCQELLKTPVQSKNHYCASKASAQHYLYQATRIHSDSLSVRRLFPIGFPISVFC